MTAARIEVGVRGAEARRGWLPTLARLNFARASERLSERPCLALGVDGESGGVAATECSTGKHYSCTAHRKSSAALRET